jgi:drug/metabolite transporter (DMT)-like permease
MGYVYIALTILFTVYGQLVIKWQVNSIGELPPGLIEKVLFILKQYLNIWIISGFASGFLASMTWIAAMTEFEISFAYPFMSLSFIIVMFFSAFFFHESLTLARLLGTSIVLIGLFIATRGTW